MLIYHFHSETGVYLGASQAEPDPLEWALARDAVTSPVIFAALSAFEAASLEAGDDLPLQRAAKAARDEALLHASYLEAEVEPPVWLVPAHATSETPPAFGFDEQAVWKAGSGWSVEPAPVAAPEVEAPEVQAPGVPESRAAVVRRERDARIEAVRYLVERHRDEIALGLTTTLTGEDYMAVLVYIQALRDVPEQDGFPAGIDWPTLAPELVAVED